MSISQLLLSDGADSVGRSIIHTQQDGMELGKGDDLFGDTDALGFQWETYSAGSGTHDGSKLIFSHSGSAVHGLRMVSYLLINDFNIQFDFDSFSRDSGSDDVALALQVIDASSNAVEIWRHEIVSASGQYFARIVGGGGSNQTATSDTAGKLRLSRDVDSDNIYCHYWDESGGDWVLLDTYNGVSTAPMRAIIFLRVDASTTGSANVDNFLVNESFFYDGSNPSPAVSPWNTYTDGLTMDMSTIDIIEYGTGSQEYKYAKNNGALNGTWLTLAQLQAESDFLVTHANSLKVQVRLVSNEAQTSGINRRGYIANDETASGSQRILRVRRHNV